MITLCVPTLNRYDLLKKLLESAERGSCVPDRYLIVDNGGKLDFQFPKMEVYTPSRNIGVAASWNWLIFHSAEIRIISNDDIEFHPDTVQVFKDSYEYPKVMYPAYSDRANIYSCFSIPDYVVDHVGVFDENISPNYGYFEDNDYDFRLKDVRERDYLVDYKAIPCGYYHLGSATIGAMSDLQQQEHHRKFKIAKANFLKKWGRLPNDN